MTAALYFVTALLTLVWLGLVLRALFADRSAGRRRCPKCFYEIDQASGLRCTECGHAAKDERALAKTHRYRGRALVLSVLLLAPALLTGGIARVQQTGGWSDLPTPVITRLLWLDNAMLHDDVISRIGRGELRRASAERVVLSACKMLESQDTAQRARGFAYLNKLGRNSAWNVESTPETPRPMLEELRPDVIIAILLEFANGDDVNNARSAVYLLRYVLDVDADVAIALLPLVYHSDSGVSERAVYALNGAGREGETRKRLHWLNYRYRETYRGSLGPSDLDLLKNFAREVEAFGDDREALKAWTVLMAEGRAEVHPDVESEAELIGRRVLALWLLCRIDEYGEASWSAVESALQERKLMLDAEALNHVYGFSWSEDVEQLLRTTMRGSDNIASAARYVAAKYKLEASALLPDVLSYFSRLDRPGGGSFDAPDEFIAMGGNPAVFHDAIIDRLETILRDSPDQIVVDWTHIPQHEPRHVSFDFAWLADLAIKDQRSADLMLAYMEAFRGESAELWAAVAYAAITGDRSGATRVFIEFDLDLTQPAVLFSPPGQFLDLINRDLADIDLLQSHYLETANAERRAAFIAFLTNLHSAEGVQPFEPALRKLENDPDPATAAAATKALQVIQK